jgi:hypothetical protein
MIFSAIDSAHARLMREDKQYAAGYRKAQQLNAYFHGLTHKEIHALAVYYLTVYLHTEDTLMPNTFALGMAKYLRELAAGVRKAA